MTFTWLDMLVVPQLVPRVRRRIEKSMVETKTRDHKETPKSWIDVYTEVTALRKHTTLLGQKVETYDQKLHVSVPETRNILVLERNSRY